MQSYDKNAVMQLCECITVKQLVALGNRIQLGMDIYSIGAQLEP